MSFQLRDYQAEALDAIRFGHQEHDSIAIELATGLGKTVVFTKYLDMFTKYNMFDNRVMVIAPQIPLIGQAAKKIQKETGEMPAIEQADQWSNETHHARSPFIVASKQSLCSGNGSKRYERFEDIGLVIVDECHYAATKQYAGMLKHFMARGAKVLGVSATLKRHDNRALGQLFEECVYQYGICEAIEEGWLVPIKVKVKQLEKLSLEKVTTTNTQFGNDFNQRELSEKLENPEVIYEIAAAVAEETRDEKTAIFCASVEEARAVAELLTDQYKIPADWICADTKLCSKQRRAEAMDGFTRGETTHLANVGILTTGWDYPALKNIVMARPTKSKPLYTQILGRVTRPVEEDGKPVVDGWPDKSLRRQAIAASMKPYGRVIDLVDNSLEHKLITSADVLGGRWSLESDERKVVCRWCFREFANSGLLSIHISEDHAEEALAMQSRDAEDVQAEQDARHEMLRKQRAEKRAEAKFRDQEVNPFGGARSSSRGSNQNEMASTKQRRYLWVLGFKDIDRYALTKSQASRVIGQLRSGKTMEDVRRTNRLAAR